MDANGALAGASISGSVSTSGSDWANYSYTETQNLAANTWAAASGTGNATSAAND